MLPCDGGMKCCILLKLLLFFAGMHIHGLAHAASGYHRVLKENRKLYNQVQDLKGNKIASWLVALGLTPIHAFVIFFWFPK